MTGSVSVPLHRIKQLLDNDGPWFGPAHQGPGGLFAIRAVGDKYSPTRYQVTRLFGRRHGDPEHDRPPESISEPYLTLEGAERFARKMAGRGPE